MRRLVLLTLALGAASMARADPYGITTLTNEWITALGPYQRTSSHQPGHSAYSIDGQAYLDRDGTTVNLGAPLMREDVGLIPGYIDVFGLDGYDRVYGIGSLDPAINCITCNTLWQWNGTWQPLGTSDIFYPSSQWYGGPTVNYYGEISGARASGIPFVWSNGVLTDPLGHSVFANTLSNDINNSGQALFLVDGWSYTDLGTNYLFYSGGQAQWITDLVSESSGWDLMHAENVHLLESGYIIGRASYAGVEADFVLGPGVQAVPEPGSASLVLAGIVVALALKRRTITGSKRHPIQ